MQEGHNPFGRKVSHCVRQKPILLSVLPLMHRVGFGESFVATGSIRRQERGRRLGKTLLAYLVIGEFRGVCKQVTDRVSMERPIWLKRGLTIRARTAMSLRCNIQNAQDANHRLPSCAANGKTFSSKRSLRTGPRSPSYTRATAMASWISLSWFRITLTASLRQSASKKNAAAYSIDNIRIGFGLECIVTDQVCAFQAMHMHF